jgi:hypothetical protein
MQRLALLSMALVCLLAAGPAHALGDFGFRAGAGLGLTLSSLAPEDDTVERGPLVPWAVGPAWHLDLSMVGFEANLLYRQGTSYVASREVEVVHHHLSLPMLLKVTLPGVSFLEAGVGIEPRLLLAASANAGAAETLETWTFYVPLALGASFDLGGLQLGAELRLEMQISNHYLGLQADDARAHDLMLYVGGFF